MGIAAVSFKDKNGIEIVIYPGGEWDNIDFNVATEEEGRDMIAYEEQEAAFLKTKLILSLTESLLQKGLAEQLSQHTQHYEKILNL